MSKRSLVGILLLPAMVVVVGLATRSDQVLNFILGPVDDPQYFCFTSDPSPAAGLNSSTVLQECSAGKTMHIGRGETIAIDLRSGGVDSATNWHDFHVSDASVLQTVVAPTNTSATGPSEEIALYRAVKTGQSSISAVQVRCGWNGSCGRNHRWKVTVEVS
jgi:predicted secreted protein